MSAPGARLIVLAAMTLPIATHAGASPCARGGESVSPWLPRQGVLRFYQGYEPRYPYTWWGGAWRHHGPGEGGYCGERGVRSLHGLGDGCYGRPVRVRPYYVVGVDGTSAADAPQSPGPPDAPAETAPPAETPEEALPGGDAADQPGPAWNAVDRRAARRALAEFAVAALRHPEQAEAKAGFGIAAAILGDDEKACWALRRAAATDLDSLHALVAPGGRPERQVRVLIARYGARRGAEARFASAILHWLLGEDTAARENAAAALAAGDADPALSAICGSTGPTESDPADAEESPPGTLPGMAVPSARPLTAHGEPLDYQSIENASQ